MKELFERLKQHGYDAIRELCQAKTQETVQLEFKTKSDPTNGVLNKADRSNLGRELSAFANSAGGLMIWGVLAAPDAEGVDAAQGEKPISDLARFTSEVSRATGEVLMPRHEGIEVHPVADVTKSDTGYLAIWVERSDRRPHRSEASGDKHYYKRAGTSSYVMEHFDVEDAFNRSVPTDLRFVLTHVRESRRTLGLPTNVEHCYHFEFSLSNDDRTSARAPYVWVDKVVGGITAEKQGITRVLSLHVHGTKQVFSGDAGVLVHPGMTVAAFNLVVPITTTGHIVRNTILDQRPEAVELAFDYAFGCQDARSKTGRFEVKGQHLRDLVTRDFRNPSGELPLKELVHRIAIRNGVAE